MNVLNVQRPPRKLSNWEYWLIASMPGITSTPLVRPGYRINPAIVVPATENHSRCRNVVVHYEDILSVRHDSHP